MKINQEKMKSEFELFYDKVDRDITEEDVVRLMRYIMGWLTSHNKNYTKQQWAYLMDIEEILDAIEL